MSAAEAAGTVAITWSVAEYVARVIVQTATATGRSVRELAGDSFALTLWTWAEVQQLEREASVERLGERTDLAGLMAVAFHDPAGLQKAELRYLSAAGRLSAMLEQTRRRLTTLAEQYEHARQRAGTEA